MAIAALFTLVAASCGGDEFDGCEARRSCPQGGASSGGASPGGNGGSAGAAGVAATGGSAGTEGGSGSGTGGGGVGGDGGSGGTGEDCDSDGSPRTEACLVDERRAVFVAPDGIDTASGTREAPVRTFGLAVSRARRSGKIVIACTGSYDENVAIKAGAAVRVYGGFDCENEWQPSDGLSTIEPATGAALEVTGVTHELLLDGLELKAASATEAGASSIAAIIRDSENVVLRQVRLVAGDGADGASGTTQGFPFTSVKNGNDADGPTGGAAQRCECPAGDETIGGKGGDGNPEGNGEAGTPDYGGGKGGLASTAECGDNGPRNGAPAPAPTDPGAGASTHGRWTSTGWVAAAGEPGVPGASGQGGGGGRGGAQGGGGGACGGCGGKGGGAGSGGGASLALISLDSNLVLEHATLITGKAGQGGAGALGQQGQEGGYGGRPSHGSACQGGNGGRGAAGAPGGGGAGGISIGVLYRGAAPVLEEASYEIGNFGAAGLGGDEARSEDDGVEGISGEVIDLATIETPESP